MIDHLMLKVRDWPRARTFYSAALAPLGYELLVDRDTWGGFGKPGQTSGRVYLRQEEQPGRLHFALRAPSAEAVQHFFDAATASGGTDNGQPGPRAHYSDGGVGCFVIDPDNNNVEVCFQA